MRIAMIGTRGVPASYGGFETAVEEVGRRLADRGHEVVVYCRTSLAERKAAPKTFLGMHLVHLPAMQRKVLETLSHTALSVAHSVVRKPDAAIVFNAANAVLVTPLVARRIPVSLHVDGIEWKRSKWGKGGRTFYMLSERLGTILADDLIADAEGIQRYYLDRYHVPSTLLAYGAPILEDVPSDRLHELGLESRGFHLVVARFEPENNVHTIVEGFRRSSSTKTLVVVGSAPYASDYIAAVRNAGADDERIRFVGSVYDQDVLNQLYAHSFTYLHGHSVGGTNPSLLRAMGTGASIIASENSFNREVAGPPGLLFASPQQLAKLVEDAEADPELTRERGEAARKWVQERYDWDDVTDGYEAMCAALVAAGPKPLRSSRRVR